MRGFLLWITMFDIELIKSKSERLPIQLTGCDEVGRGPLAGPVVACAMTLKIESDDLLEFSKLINKLKKMGVNDSKKLTPEKRRDLIKMLGIKSLKSNQINSIELSKKIQIKYTIKEISADTIDQINILQASLLAMNNAALDLDERTIPHIVLIDGNKVFKEAPKNMELISVVKGDAKVILIGLASVVAKEYRDLLMSHLSLKYPEYGWESNAGYPTKSHLKSIEVYGLTSWHRKTFRGVKEIYEQRGVERS